MSDKTVLAEAAQLAADFEGFSSVAYLDPVGVPTIGYGSTVDRRLPGNPKVTLQTPPVNKQLGLKWLQAELHSALTSVQLLAGPGLTDNEEVALTDFVFNLGAGAFAGSTLRQDLLKGDHEAAAAQFERWDMAGGKVLAGLLRRRKAEVVRFTKKG